MSELRGNKRCPRGPHPRQHRRDTADAVLQDWTTYVSVVCQFCGYKFGELGAVPDRKFGEPGPDTIAVLFHWHTRNGTCLDCGLPAAYFSYCYRPGDDPARKCCVCAATDAADGINIVRIEPET